jgi:hypothetical protein
VPGTPILADTQAVAKAARRPASTIRSWAHGNLITRKGVDRKGRALYDLDEVCDLAEALDAAEKAACLDKAPDLRQHLEDIRSSAP